MEITNTITKRIKMPNKFINYETLLISLAMITMGSTLTALMKPQKTIWQTLKYWFAGIVAGILVMLFAYSNNYTGMWWDIAKITVSTFVTNVYPIVEKFVKAYLDKKSDILVSNAKNDKLI